MSGWKYVVAIGFALVLHVSLVCMIRFIARQEIARYLARERERRRQLRGIKP